MLGFSVFENSLTLALKFSREEEFHLAPVFTGTRLATF